MADTPEAITRRRSLVEHPFGILKHMMGTPRFLCRGLSAVKAEMALCPSQPSISSAPSTFPGPETSLKGFQSTRHEDNTLLSCKTLLKI
jgi:hypothetical protein